MRAGQTSRRKRRQCHRLLTAQRNRCHICGDIIEGRGSRDHVWPLSRYPGIKHNKLVGHGRCNVDKGNRDPTGCELIMLAAVNAKLYGV